jgi:hypothetical protein
VYKKEKKENQLFKTPVPVHVLWDFLKQHFTETETHILITKYLFHKAEYNDSLALTNPTLALTNPTLALTNPTLALTKPTLSQFISLLKDHYYLSKRKYIDRPLTYKFFLTLIRQLCNAHHIQYSTKLVYDKSTYEIEYCIAK